MILQRLSQLIEHGDPSHDFNDVNRADYLH